MLCECLQRLCHSLLVLNSRNQCQSFAQGCSKLGTYVPLNFRVVHFEELGVNTSFQDLEEDLLACMSS